MKLSQFQRECAEDVRQFCVKHGLDYYDVGGDISEMFLNWLKRKRKQHE